jgi:hypothetical protein
MRHKNETRKRSARCPECGQFFSPQGLNGHLRFHHGQEGKTVKTAQKEAVIAGGIAERARVTMELVRQLKQVREQKLELEKFADEDDGDDLFGGEPDQAMADAIAALTLSEKELSAELRKASGRNDLPAKKPGFLDALFGGGDDLALADAEESGEDDDDL